jgi:hypothetical protein
MGLITALTEGTFAIPKVEFSQNILYPHGSESMNIERMFFCPIGYPGGQGRKIVNSGDFFMPGVDKAGGQFPKVKPAAIRVDILEGAVIEVKAVYIDTYSGFGHSGLPGCPCKEIPGTLTGGASVNSACGY